jgi:hypothetical protein
MLLPPIITPLPPLELPSNLSHVSENPFKDQLFSGSSEQTFKYQHYIEYCLERRAREGIILQAPSISEIKAFCEEIGVPFPSEANNPYASWWRLLHEIGHWAVKPDYYNEYGIKIYNLALSSDGKEYKSGSDVVPDIAMAHDPTPNEFSVRWWCILTALSKNWPLPHELEEVVKPATARLWLADFYDPKYVEGLQLLQRWGIQPLFGIYRPTMGQNFNFPHPDGIAPHEILTNHEALAEYLNTNTTLEWDPTEPGYWPTFLNSITSSSAHSPPVAPYHYTPTVTLKDLKEFAKLINVPFPVESKDEYNILWRILHEMGHWAVKPPWYNDWAAQLLKLKVDYKNNTYPAGNDKIPDIFMLNDPTPDEWSVQWWCRLVCEYFRWEIPIEEAVRPWNAKILHPITSEPHGAHGLELLDFWGIDPLKGIFRPREDGFTLPFPYTEIPEEILQNHQAILKRYGSNHPGSKYMNNYWLNVIFTKFPEYPGW